MRGFGEPLTRRDGIAADDLESIVRRWFVMSILTGRYSGSPETAFDFDIRQIDAQGLLPYAESVIKNELPATFWTGMLPQLMDTSSSTSPYFISFQAAQAKLGDRGFLSREITVRDLILNRGDKHHIFPRKDLQRLGLTRGRYNQIANFVLAQSEINIAIGDKPPEHYFAELRGQISGKVKHYGGIIDEADLLANLNENAIPRWILDTSETNDMNKEARLKRYEQFLSERRKLMALKIKRWFEGLS